jgi:hypothetical protein
MIKRRLPDKTRHEIYAHWVHTGNYLETSRSFGCTANTVKNIVLQMPEYYAREHEHQRRQFVQETWMLARQALRELAKRLPAGTLKEVSIAYGILADRATVAMYAPTRARTPDMLIHNEQKLTQNVITAEDIHDALKQYRQETGQTSVYARPLPPSLPYDGNGKK